MEAGLAKAGETKFGFTYYVDNWNRQKTEYLLNQNGMSVFRIVLYTVSQNFQFELPLLGNCAIKNNFKGVPPLWYKNA